MFYVTAFLFFLGSGIVFFLLTVKVDLGDAVEYNWLGFFFMAVRLCLLMLASIPFKNFVVGGRTPQ